MGVDGESAARILLTSESGSSGSAERERRGRKLRRESDHRQSMLSELAVWFANRDVRAVLIVDEQCNVLLINEAARSLIEAGKGLNILNGKLGFDHERQRDEFERWWSDGLDEMPVTLRPSRSAAAISVSRIQLDGVPQRLALLTIAGSVPPSIDQVRQQFGLTNAEAEIALGIFRGMSLVQIARSRQASINTVKTQARYIFQKCRVHSQSALTRRIGELVQKSS